MVCLSAHSRCAYALYSSKAAISLGSSTKAAAALCPLRDRRGCGSGGSSYRRLSIQCNVEKRLGDTDLCAGRDVRGQCRRVAAAKAVSWSVEELEERFGQPGVKFVGAAGYTILEMRLKEGSSARIVVQSAVVASFKTGMWHGGVEEILHTLVVPGVEESQRPTTVGGVSLRVWEAGAGKDSNLAARECWDVENVRSSPAKFVQVTLSTTSEGDRAVGASAGHILQFQYVITLTAAALSCAVIATNVGTSAVSIHGSLETSVSVNFVNGAYALGLRGCKYLSTSPNSVEEGMLSKLQQLFSGVEKDKKRNDRSLGPEEKIIVEEEEEMVQMKGGFDRLYIAAPDCMPLLDRGKRRTINFQNIGFEDIRLSNPGEELDLEDWDSFVCVELARSRRPVHVQPGEEWRAAQQLVNPSK